MDRKEKRILDLPFVVDSEAAERKIEQLEQKLQQRNEVVAELMQEHVQSKKGLAVADCGEGDCS